MAENTNTKTTTVYTEEQLQQKIAEAVNAALQQSAEADEKKAKIKKFLKGTLLVLLGGAAGAAGATIVANQSATPVAGYVSDATSSTSV